MINISFNSRNRDKVQKWIEDNKEAEVVSYSWPSTNITFYNEEDALAFTLAVGGVRFKSRLEKMLEFEDEKGLN